MGWRLGKLDPPAKELSTVPDGWGEFANSIHCYSRALLITEEWINETHPMFLAMIRSHWRGWNLVLFEDRATQQKSPEILDYTEQLGIEVRLLPRATPELNAMDHLWRPTKRETVGRRATLTVAGFR